MRDIIVSGYRILVVLTIIGVDPNFIFLRQLGVISIGIFSEDLENNQDIAFHHVLKMIILRELLPGEMIHETSIGKYTGLSRTPVREAFIRLMQYGMLEQIPGKRGYFIPLLTVSDMREVFVARECLERQIASLCAQHASGLDIEFLEQLNSNERDIEALKPPSAVPAQNGSDRASLMDDNAKFHLELARIAKNRYLQNTYEMIYWRSQLYDHYIIDNHIVNQSPFPVALEQYFQTRERERSVPKEHADIISAIHARDTRTAGQAAAEHLQHTTAYLIAFKFPEVFEENLRIQF